MKTIRSGVANLRIATKRQRLVTHTPHPPARTAGRVHAIRESRVLPCRIPCRPAGSCSSATERGVECVFPIRRRPGATKKLNSDLTKKHPLLVWASLRPGDTIVLRGSNSQHHVGTVVAGTNDGLIVWIRTDLNERKMFHFHDCESVSVIQDRSSPNQPTAEERSSI